MSGSTLNLYLDANSQPCRAVWLFCLENDIPFNFVDVAIVKGEHRTNEQVKAANPRQQLPAMDDAGFGLGESHAMLRYLATTRKTPDHWYPADPQRRARVDQYLESHHHGLRSASDHMRAALVPHVMGYDAQEAQYVMKRSEIALKRALKLMDESLAKQAYLAGDEISIADLSAACEYAQLIALLPTFDVSSYEHVTAWYKRVTELKHWNETNVKLGQLAQRLAAAAAERAKAAAAASASASVSPSASA